MRSEQPLVIAELAGVELPTRRLAVDVYDDEIAIRLLYEDPDTGAEHRMVSYAATPGGLRGRQGEWSGRSS